MQSIILFALSLSLLTGCMMMCGMGGHTRHKERKHDEVVACGCNCIKTLGRCDCVEGGGHNHKA
ncbi:MAG TPA: hypothetical protein ACFYD1_01730 [Candidatus Hypogeohydataceae bacterium YC38]|nr:hypothetical protein [Candidatus Brocadiales bacterium]